MMAANTRVARAASGRIRWLVWENLLKQVHGLLVRFSEPDVQAGNSFPAARGRCGNTVVLLDFIIPSRSLRGS
jgi:hypothetical protein